VEGGVVCVRRAQCMRCGGSSVAALRRCWHADAPPPPRRRPPAAAWVAARQWCCEAAVVARVGEARARQARIEAAHAQ